MEVLNVAMRVLHVVSAVMLVGGFAFLLVGMMPATKLLEENLRQQLIATARKKFYKISHAAITLLILTGVYNWMANTPIYREAANKGLLQGLLGTKSLLGLAIAVILFAASAGVFKKQTGGEVKWIVILGVVIIVMAAVVRHLRLDAMAGM
jgi:uncharacterized membrane protein